MRSAGGAQTAATIHVAMIPNEPAVEVYFAKDMGFFSKAGIDVDIAQNPSAGDRIGGRVETYDIAYSTISTPGRS